MSSGIGDALITPALTRVMESIYCRDYYRIHKPSLIGSDGSDGVKEEYCKTAEIQGNVAMLKGWQIALESVGSLLLAIPFGWFADTYGRKPLMLMLAVSFVLKAAWIQIVCFFWQIFPIQLVWLSALHSFMGGGDTMALATLFTIIADVTSPAERSAVFFRLGVAAYSIQFFAPILGASLMSQFSPWLPMLLGLAMRTLPVLFTIMLPETLPAKPPLEATPITEVDRSGGEEEDSSQLDKSPTTLLTKLCRALTRAHHATAFITSSPRLLFLIPTALLHISIINTDVLLQYTSTRYALPLSRATILLSLRSGVIALTFLFALPDASHHLTRRLRYAPIVSDLYLVRASALIGAAGYALIALSPNVAWLVPAFIVSAGCTGTFLLTKGLATHMVEARHVARLYSVMAIFDTL
ncbi:hypothetical protein LTS18_013625, partial [Coniosporium uncinatum]